MGRRSRVQEDRHDRALPQRRFRSRGTDRLDHHGPARAPQRAVARAPPRAARVPPCRRRRSRGARGRGARQRPGVQRRPRPERDDRARLGILPPALRRLRRGDGDHPGNPAARHRRGAGDRDGRRMPAGCLLRSGRRGGRGALRHARGEDRPVLHHAHGRAHPRHRSPEGDGDAAHGRADHRGRSACRGAGESRGPGFRAAGGHARPGGPDRRLQPVRGRPRQEGVLPAAADGPGGRLRLRLGGDVRERRRGGRAGGHERVPAEARALLARPVSSTRVFPSRRSAMLTLLVALAAAAAHAQAKTPRGLEGLDSLYPELDALYLDMHRNPELSGHEEKTAAKLAERLRRLGYEVTTGVGGTGVVGVLRNGTGPTVLLRTELDALPVEEKTGLPYASKATATDPAGKTVPVMHACGHDVHMASWTGAAALLSRAKDRWRGTVVMVGQPAEETVAGAKAMLADRFLERFPKPDFSVAVHDSSDLPAGKVAWIPGYALANVDSVDVTVFGRGGHGAKPDTTVDPVVIAARTVLSLQTLVSREKDPLERRGQRHLQRSGADQAARRDARPRAGPGQRRRGEAGDGGRGLRRVRQGRGCAVGALAGGRRRAGEVRGRQGLGRAAPFAALGHLRARSRADHPHRSRGACAVRAGAARQAVRCLRPLTWNALWITRGALLDLFLGEVVP